MAPCGERHGECEPVRTRPRLRGTRPAEPDATASPAPAPARAGQLSHPAAPNPARTSSTTFTRGPVDCLDAPQHYDTVRVRRHGERLPAFRSRRANPAAPPDEAPALVLAAPDVPGIRWRDCVGAATAEQAAENRRASHRGAHSHEIAPSGLTMAPHSPSAIREYSRSTCGRDPVTGRLLFDDERAPARCRARSGG